MDLSEIRNFEIGKERPVDLVEVLFTHDGFSTLRPGYATGIDDYMGIIEETDSGREIREDIEGFERAQLEGYRTEPDVNPPYLEFHKCLEGHNQTPGVRFPIRTDDIIGIRRLGIVQSEQDEYTPSNVVEVMYKNPELPRGSEIRSGYVDDIESTIEMWSQDTKPPHIDLYTQLKDGTPQNPIHMKSSQITRLNRLFIAESIGFP